MAQQLEPLNLRVTGSAQGLAMSLGKAEGTVAAFAKKVESQLAGIQASIPSLDKIGASLATGFAGFKVFEAFKLAAQAEQAAVAFEVLTGSVAESSKMLEQIRALAAATPLSFAGLQENAKMMLGFGISVEQVLPNLRVLGDISGGSVEKMRMLTLAFSQSAAAGRLMGQDLLQMINAGFNPLQEISQKTGRTMAQLKKDMENGAVSFDMVREAFVSSTQAGGRFNGMLERQSTTLAGSTGILVDKVQQLAASMAGVFAPAVKEAANQLTKMVEFFQKFSAESLRSAVSMAAGVAAFVAFTTIAPRVIAAVQSIAKGFALMQSLSGWKGIATLTAGLLAYSFAASQVDAAFRGYSQSVFEANRKAIEANGAQNALADSVKAIEGAASQAAIALEKMAAAGLNSGAANNTAAQVEKFKQNIEQSQKSLAQLNAELARAAKTEGYAKTVNDLLNAQRIADDLRAKSAAASGGKGWFSGIAFTEADANLFRQQIEIIKAAQQQMERLKTQLGGDTSGRSAEQIKADIEATNKAIADMTAEVDSLNGSLAKNEEYWKAQAEAARKTFELPIDTFKDSLASLAEAVRQGGLEMSVFDRAAASALENLRKATEEKKELAKPVQFSAAVTKGSAADIQDRFRFRTSSSQQQTVQKQDEANRLLEQIRDALIKGQKQNPPVAKIT